MDKMLLVDGNSLMHRAFHAMPVMTNSSGEYTNALHGFLMMLLKVIEDEKPNLCAIAFDRHEPTFRHVEYAEYKAGRAPTAFELKPQFPAIRAILQEMHIAVLEQVGYEADDILGTMSRKCEEKGIEALIVTGDRDSFQLVGEHTCVLYTVNGIKDTERVTPQWLMDKWQIDTEQFIDLKGLMGDASDNIPGIKGIGEKTALKLLSEYSSLENILLHADEQKGKLKERLTEGAQSARFSRRLATIIRNAPVEAEPAECRLHDIGDAREILAKYELRQVSAKLSGLTSTAVGAAESTEPSSDVQSLDEFIRTFDGSEKQTVFLYMGNALYIGFNTHVCMLPLGGGDLIDPGLDQVGALEAVRPITEKAEQLVVHDLKQLKKYGLSCSGKLFDVMLAGYVLSSQLRSFSLLSLCAEAGIKLNEAAPLSAMMQLYDQQKERLQSDGLDGVMNDIELPLCEVLFGMEQAGVLTDKEALMTLNTRFGEKIGELAEQIRSITGTAINFNSPKQLGTYLFEELKLSGGKKTKTGWSTSADILEAIQDSHPVIPLILEYRKYNKLQSTYVDALLRLRDGEGLIHTCFDQTSTSTGRISSLEPNIQNIPVRTPMGREIRRVFVAHPGYVLVDADYSQIELRVLAHLSGDAVMQDAFNKGQDIHARTAAEVNGLPIECITPEMRSAAKAVNFGIVYGISDFGLARQINVSRQQAGEFIELYLLRYPGIKKYMDSSVAFGKTNGYVTTMYGRRRYLPELTDRNYNIRQFGERAAMNSPVQGTAADIIKLAMIRVDEALKEKGWDARLILQVHDELIIEAKAEIAPQVASLLKECMENIVKLDVPLIAEVNCGHSWYECK